MNIVQNVIYKSHRKEKLNILYFIIGGHELTLAAAHNLFIVDNQPKIDEFCGKYKKEAAPLTFFPVRDNKLDIYRYIPFDLIIVNNRINFHLARSISPFYQIPVIIVENEKPDLQNWQKKQISLECSSAIIISFDESIFKHWNENGVLLKEQDWQKLLYDVTKGGFNASFDHS